MMLWKKIIPCILLLWLPFAAAALELPARPVGASADFANVIKAEDKATINRVAQVLWEQGRFGLVVTTLPDLEDEEIRDVANRLYEKWGIGEKGKDEGALVLLSLIPSKIWVETGYGSEGYLNDSKVGRIIDTYGMEHFRQNMFSAGILGVCAGIASEVVKEKKISDEWLTAGSSRQRVPVTRKAQPQGTGILQTIFIIIVIALLLGTRFGRAILFYMLLSSLLGGGRRGGGGFGGGFGGGGFGGGFGGGSSGGGGAGRSF